MDSRACLLVACSLFAACAEADGRDPYALWRTYEHPSGTYHFHYLAPPWEPATETPKFRPVLAVDPDEDVAHHRIVGSGMTARYLLTVEVVGTASAKAAADADARLWANNGFEAEEVEKFESSAGDGGLRIRARGSDRELTAVYFELPEGAGVVALRLAGKERVFVHDIDLLLKSLEPRAADGE